MVCKNNSFCLKQNLSSSTNNMSKNLLTPSTSTTTLYLSEDVVVDGQKVKKIRIIKRIKKIKKAVKKGFHAETNLLSDQIYSTSSGRRMNSRNRVKPGAAVVASWGIECWEVAATREMFFWDTESSMWTAELMVLEENKSLYFELCKGRLLWRGISWSRALFCDIFFTKNGGEWWSFRSLQTTTEAANLVATQKLIRRRRLN